MQKLLLRLKMRIYLLVTATYIVVAFLSTALFYFITPQHYFAVYPSMDVFYWLCGIGLTYLLDRYRRKNPDKLLYIFMMCRGIKLCLVIALLVIGIRVLEVDKTNFTIALMSNHLIYSVLEVYIYYRFNKRIAERKCKR